MEDHEENNDTAEGQQEEVHTTKDERPHTDAPPEPEPNDPRQETPGDQLGFWDVDPAPERAPHDGPPHLLYSRAEFEEMIEPFKCKRSCHLCMDVCNGLDFGNHNCYITPMLEPGDIPIAGIAPTDAEDPEH